MTKLSEYEHRYENIVFSREDGILTLRVRTNGGPLLWDAPAHRDLGLAFRDVALDDANQVVILTGTGDDFLASYDWHGPKPDSSAGWHRTYTEGYQLLLSFLDIPVPTIAALNGPVRLHAELPLLAEVVVAAKTTVFQDASHFIAGMVPGDGANLIWEAMIGLGHARHFLLSGREISAQEGTGLGIVTHVVPAADVVSVAQGIAQDFLKRTPLTLRYTRTCLTMSIRERLERHLRESLLLEGLAAIDMRRPS